MLNLKQLIVAFLAHVKTLVNTGTHSPKTLRWYDDLLKPLAPLHDLPAESVRVCHLVDIKMTNGRARALKRMFAWAADEDLIRKDYFRKFKGPRCGRRKRVLSRAELNALFRVCSPQLFRLLWVMLHTISRPGEMRMLTWGQINWKEECIILKEFKGKDRRHDKLEERSIAMKPVVIRLLRNMHRKSPDRSSTGRVFYSPRGKAWSSNGLRSAMMRARALVGLDRGGERIVCYHLRHTSATNAIREGEDLKLVAELMGHASTTTTERYCHLDRTDIVEAIKRIAARPRSRKPKPVVSVAGEATTTR